jgi:methylmalonyl-CoA decarboxylase subunit alpha
VTLESEALEALRKQAQAGGAQRYHEANAARGKLFARERIAQLVDPDSFVEDGRYANALADGLPADGVITGSATIDGRPVCLMANDSTVKAGSWGARTVEKIIRIIEKAYATSVPMIYLVDSAGARITDQVDLFPGRRGAGNIFYNQVRASGSIPQVCALFGPSAAGGAYIPAFCDVVAMVDGNASMYLGSDRMVEMVTGEKTTLEAMGGAKVHTTESGVGHFLCKDEAEALATVKRYLSYLPSNWTHRRRPRGPGAGERAAGLRHAAIHQGPARRGHVLRDSGVVGQGTHDRFRATERRGRRRGRQQLDVQGRRALRRLRR